MLRGTDLSTRPASGVGSGSLRETRQALLASVALHTPREGEKKMDLDKMEVTELDPALSASTIGGLSPQWILGFVLGSLFAASMKMLDANTYMPG
ncbi:MAG: hypothetical protein NVS4B3_26090 [Gemmatimonadaceae bacterium]